MEVFSDSANWLTHCWSSRCSREYIRAMEAVISKKFSVSTCKDRCQQKQSLPLSHRCNAKEYEPLKLQLVIQGIKRWPREKSVKKYWKGFVIVQSVRFFCFGRGPWSGNSDHLSIVSLPLKPCSAAPSVGTQNWANRVLTAILCPFLSTLDWVLVSIKKS